MGIAERLRRLTENECRGAAPYRLAFIKPLRSSIPAANCIPMNPSLDHSNESRFHGLSALESLSGKLLTISSSCHSMPENLWASPEKALNFISKTRWSRTFQFVRGYPLE